MTNKNVREAALEILETVEKNKAYSNLLLNNTIEKYQFSHKDAGLLTEICYGTIQRQMTLTFSLNRLFQKQKTRSMGSSTPPIICISVCLPDKIPPMPSLTRR